jgi:sensor c-di-GMP phosphodiesterase-like protein
MRLGILPHIRNEEFSSDVMGQFMKAAAACSSLKAGGPSSIGFFDEKLQEQKRLKESLLKDFDQAIEQRQFVVFYQPKFSIEEKPSLRSAEALVRWIHPERGMISPGIFIPLFEKNALIERLDRYVWSHAAQQVAKWKKMFGTPIPVSVNVSRIDLFDQKLESVLLNIVK